ncbi:MAG: hypothetical protein ACREPB_08150 [Arenimonas sp.]
MKSVSTAKFRAAMKMLDCGDAAQALKIGKELLQSRDESHILAGHLCVGLIYETGGFDFTPDIETAVYHYRLAAAITPDPISFCYLARALMKRNEADYLSAYKYLNFAKEIKETPQVMLGFAQYYRTRPKNSDLASAKKYYLRAALHGRFDGFFGYASVCRELKQNFRALFVDCARLLTGPFIALLIGSDARDRF